MIAEKIQEILQAYVDTYHKGRCSRAARALGIPNDTLRTWLVGTRSPLGKIGPVLDCILGEFAAPKQLVHLQVQFDEGKPCGSSESQNQNPEPTQTSNDQKIALLEQENASLKRELAYCKEINRQLFSVMQSRSTQPEDTFSSLPMLPSDQDSPVK